MLGSEDKSTEALSFGPPPIWPDIKDELRKYIECPERLPIHQLDNAQCYWKREPDILSLLEYDLAPIGTTLKFNWDPSTGQIKELHETVLQGVGDTPRNSMSMTRAPGPMTERVTGNSSNILFWPGGFDEPEMLKDVLLEDINFEENLRTVAKGFSAGIEYKSDNCTPKEETESEPNLPKPIKHEEHANEEKVNLVAILQEEENSLGLWATADETKEKAEQDPDPSLTEQVSLEKEIPVLLEDIPVLNISEEPKEKTHAEWAEQLDVTLPVPDFEKEIPDPAMKFDYELDTFQKQAILKLEKGCNVFVAAHTSAGKTTVAEYAIALTQKHMTRVIYTSPIKALSNQKYRDFKSKFESVGLLTGDIQINQGASCLILTTEILQSMLYCASEVLRDLEFVIFDEVHYINDEDRGHVWEEIVILLPQSVNIVMLSATVPNPLVFANWVGRIKRRKMYVINTLKRPVPLQHYLYTGTDATQRDDKFLLLDADGQFILSNWYLAYKKKQPGKNAKSPIKRSHLTPKQEKDVWRLLLSHLSKNDMLPVVVFTLSRKGCDMNAAALTSLNLTTAAEKHQVHVFFKNAIKHLKGTDRELPQVVFLQTLLTKGIGIHHSGILPILKEIVEMLFQQGIVKLLFATETFAMGVNMPTRTVVFDSIRKFDGTSFRILFPTEYIQMAGRAGRRGHDETGTVIIMCRTEVPPFNNLKTMMCGKPQTLESKFKVTYSMVLNLRRVSESVTVEGMMRRSFKEAVLVSRQSVFETELVQVQEELQRMPPLTGIQKKLEEFYKVAVNYLEELRQLKPRMMEHKKAVKSLTEGRVLIVSQGRHYKKLALILSLVANNRNASQMKVLILNNANDQDENSSKEMKPERWYSMINLTKTKIFVPCGVPSHEVLLISVMDIMEITNCQIKVDCVTVLNDWEKRQIARFKNDAPGSTCQLAVQQLLALSMTAANEPDVLLPYVELKPFCKNTVHRLVTVLWKKLSNMGCTEIPNFEEQFEPVFCRFELENKKRQLQLKLSDEGLSLYPEYVNMVALLKTLGYIDNDERVALKGKVALQMGTNELLITELILKNVLTVLAPAEIAALLSTLIFQQRSDVKPTLTPELENGLVLLGEVFGNLVKLEHQHNICTIQPLNFGLVEVVYEWAQGKSFADITKKTDVQEGIIVRCIQQLNDTLQDVKNAAVTIGDPVLKEKMEEASTAIKRDIVFTVSLYTQE